ncbi:MAG: proton-conducting transporter membrane subunit [Desulfobulbaceae bacterium]|nr:proton-conducting transporter membrane subunit [Desulfobulbaceae bacterium]
MVLFLGSIILILASALAGIACRWGGRLWPLISLMLILTGCTLGIFAITDILLSSKTGSLLLPWAVPGGGLAFHLDGLAAVFLYPALLVIAVGSLYAEGYSPVAKNPASGSWLRTFYPLLSAGILLVLVADNAVFFLFSWELMALAGFFLVVTDRNDKEPLRAGFIYLAATHTGTIALFGMFAMLGSFHLDQLLPTAASFDGNTSAATIIFLLALLGFGLKAGLMPLHIWLPGAHAAAPSNVSALMSGVMIKVGIYGLIRITGYFTNIPNWWGWTILGLGLVSALLGVVFAIAQHDIKRLLAFHSVENIGIILLGLGIALLGRSYHAPAMVALGLAGALLHVINHGLFKGLLFLSVGAMIHATDSRRLTDYGGLLQTMPLTGFFFLGGAIAICGLPPLNGFISEWLIYLGLFQAAKAASQVPPLILLAMPGLAMTGGLALLCFAKVFGLSFLGAPRKERPGQEPPLTMLLPLMILLTACTWIGLAPTTTLPLLTRATEAWLGKSTTFPPPDLVILAPAGNISRMAITMILLFAAGYFLCRPKRNKEIPQATTWSCGYSMPLPRARYTATSFAEMTVHFFSWALRTRIKPPIDTSIFPTKEPFSTHTPDAVLDLLLRPATLFIVKTTGHLRSIIQHGTVGLYLLYTAITLLALLIYVSL